MKNRLLPVLALSFAALAGCEKDQAARTPAAVEPPPSASSPALLSPETAKETAPETYKVRIETTQGPMTVEVRRAWAPNGADRFYNLVKRGFYDGCAFFRVVDGFMAQLGIHGDPAVAAKWRGASIPDDPPAPGASNRRGYVAFAMAGPNTRTTQIFFSFKDNSFLDAQGFTPFGKVVEGEPVLDKLYRGYGEGAPVGRGPDQGRIQMQGNAYLKAEFPGLDYIKSARLL